MDIVYASLPRRPDAGEPPPGEKAEVLAALWAHARPEDGLEHATVRPGPDRLDLLLFLLTLDPHTPGVPTALHRAATLLHRFHRASALMARRYRRPELPAADPGNTAPAA